MSLLDAKQSRPLEGGPSFTVSHRVFRAAWQAAWIVLAAWTPPPLYRWRGLVLRWFGAQVSSSAKVYGSARIWYPPNLILEDDACLGPQVNCYNMAPIRLGRGAIVSQGSHLCAGTHDIDDPDFQLVVRPISIGAKAWVAAEAFVGPGVTVGPGAVIGARSVLTKNAEAGVVYAGNPARQIRVRKVGDMTGDERTR